MTTIRESQLLSDLGEIITTLDEPPAEITPDEVFAQTLARVQTRCVEARDGLLAARSSYEADEVENKVVALEYAQATSAAAEEVLAVQEELQARALSKRALARLTEAEVLRRLEWVDSAFPQQPSWWAKASQKDVMGAFERLLERVRGADSLATAEEVEALALAVAQAQAAYQALVRERLDDKPISDALRAAFLTASAHRSGARAVIQGVLTMEGSDLTIDAFLKRRVKRKTAKAADASPVPVGAAGSSTDGSSSN
jgi:hypothetical protein